LRLVSIVAIDSYYSHQPIRLQLVNALSLFDTISDGRERSGLEGTLRTLAGLLADELYLHPDAIAVHRGYQRLAYGRLRSRFDSSKSVTKEGFIRLIEQVMLDGVGRPRPGIYTPLFRLTFTARRRPLSRYLYRDQRLESDIAGGSRIIASIIRNPHSGDVYVDTFRSSESPLSDACRTIWRTSEWLLGMALEQAQHFSRNRIGMGPHLQEEGVRRLFVREAHRLSDSFSSLFWGAVDLIVPESKRLIIQPHDTDPYERSPIVANVSTTSGYAYSPLEDQLGVLLDRPQLDPGRRSEIQLLKAVVRRAKAPIVVACTERMCLRDPLNRDLVEWDSVIVEISNTRLRITILESKKGARRSSDQAFKQLGKSVTELGLGRHVKYARTRLRGGAKLTVDIGY
jgi:hypothetical protein